jgi:hypothetical protein
MALVYQVLLYSGCHSSTFNCCNKTGQARRQNHFSPTELPYDFSLIFVFGHYNAQALSSYQNQLICNSTSLVLFSIRLSLIGQTCNLAFSVAIQRNHLIGTNTRGIQAHLPEYVRKCRYMSIMRSWSALFQVGTISPVQHLQPLVRDAFCTCDRSPNHPGWSSASARQKR